VANAGAPTGLRASRLESTPNAAHNVPTAARQEPLPISAYVIALSKQSRMGRLLDRPDSQSVISTEGDAAPTELDAAGQAILKLLHKAAGVADANSRHALETAQKLSRQLGEAENGSPS
jgi:hypothetical protein